MHSSPIEGLSTLERPPYGSTPTSTPPVGNATTAVISSETHDLKNRRAAFHKRYNTSDMTDDEVLGYSWVTGKNLQSTNHLWSTLY